MRAQFAPENGAKNDGVDLFEETSHAETPLTPSYSRCAQKIPMVIPRGNKVFNVAIEMAPLTDDDYFNLMEQLMETVKRTKNLSSDLLDPMADLGRRLAIARHGWKERDDWRESTSDLFFVNAVRAMAEVAMTDDGEETNELLDDDAEIKIGLASVFNGEERRTFVYFREPSKADLDEYLAAKTGQPRKNALASAAKISKQRRFYDLFLKLKTRVEGYEHDDIPAWHGVAAVESYMEATFAQLGKSNLA